MGVGKRGRLRRFDIVILDSEPAPIVNAVLFGRTIFKSIRKFITFQLIMNLCATAVSFIGPFIGIDAPVTVVQMLWINMIMDTLGALASAGEAPNPRCLREAPVPRSQGLITLPMLASDTPLVLVHDGGMPDVSEAARLPLTFPRRLRSVLSDGIFRDNHIHGDIHKLLRPHRQDKPSLRNIENPAFVLIMALASAVQFDRRAPAKRNTVHSAVLARCRLCRAHRRIGNTDTEYGKALFP